MSLPSEIIERARDLYQQGSDNQDRLDWLTEALIMKKLRAYDKGERRTLSPEMSARLAEFAAWAGFRPADPALEARALEHVANWNDSPYGAHFKLSDATCSTHALVRRYLGETGTHKGQKRRTLYRRLSTDGLDAAAICLRPHCPHPWYIASNYDLSGSLAEQWLLREMLPFEPRLNAAVVRAIIDRTRQA